MFPIWELLKQPEDFQGSNPLGVEDSDFRVVGKEGRIVFI